MAFLALLIDILLDVLASFGCRFLRLPRGAAVILAACVLLVLVLGGCLLVAVPLIRESTSFFAVLKEQSATAAEKLQHWKEEFPWLGQFVPTGESSAAGSAQASVPGVARKALVTVSSLVEWSTDALAIFFLAIFLAWDPDRWLRGVAELGPRAGTEERRAFGALGVLLSVPLGTTAYLIANETIYARRK